MSWPVFTFPFGAWFFLALIPLVILYFLKLKRPRLEIPSLALWQSVINDQRVNSPFQKFRRNLLLLLQMLLLCLLILALMQPFLSAGPESAEYLPILIDCSASMAATREGGDETRLDLIKQQVQEQIDSLRSDQRMALFSFSTSGRRLTEFTNDRRQLTKALQQLTPSHLPAKLDDVLRMAAAYTRTFPIDTVTVMTDGNLNDQVDFELPFKLDVRKVEPGGPNIGITELNARRSGPEDWDVFVRVSGSTVDVQTGELRLFRNGELYASDTVEVASDESQRFIFPITSAESVLLEARVVPAGFDALSLDDSVWLNLPEARPLKVWASDELFSWKHALNVLPRLELDETTDNKPSAADYDLLVSDTAQIGDVQAPVKIFIGVVPADVADLVTVADEQASVVDWNRTAPLLRHVLLSDVQIGQRPNYSEGISEGDLEERGYEVLIAGSTGPLLLQKRLGLEVEYWFLFHTDRSTLPYRVGFPILVSNSVETALRQASLSEVNAAPTGVLPALNLESDRSYTVKAPDGEITTITSTASGLLTGAPAGIVGRYDVLDGDQIVASVGTGLLSSVETSLESLEELRFTELDISTTESDTLQADRPLWWVLALLAFGVLLVEWWYFQRARGATA
ncbi:MAG: BatA and WFA domain-containing protein [Planctomycetaceae bacterium]